MNKLDVFKTDLIREFIKTNNFSIKEFCKCCRISTCTLYKILNAQDFRLDAIFKVAKTMNMKVVDLIK